MLQFVGIRRAGRLLEDVVILLRIAWAYVTHTLLDVALGWGACCQLLHVAQCRDMIQTVDLRNPHQWFPVARALQRR